MVILWTSAQETYTAVAACLTLLSVPANGHLRTRQDWTSRTSASPVCMYGGISRRISMLCSRYSGSSSQIEQPHALGASEIASYSTTPHSKPGRVASCWRARIKTATRSSHHPPRADGKPTLLWGRVCDSVCACVHLLKSGEGPSCPRPGNEAEIGCDLSWSVQVLGWLAGGLDNVRMSYQLLSRRPRVMLWQARECS